MWKVVILCLQISAVMLFCVGSLLVAGSFGLMLFDISEGHEVVGEERLSGTVLEPDGVDGEVEYSVVKVHTDDVVGEYVVYDELSGDEQEVVDSVLSSSGDSVSVNESSIQFDGEHTVMMGDTAHVFDVSQSDAQYEVLVYSLLFRGFLFILGWFVFEAIVDAWVDEYACVVL